MNRRAFLAGGTAAASLALPTPALVQTITALSGVDLTPAAGRVYTFLGPSGAGKTTIIHMLPGKIGLSIGTDDSVIVDLTGREIYVNDLGTYTGLGKMMSELRKQMGLPEKPPAGAASSASSGTGDAELDALYHGIPQAMLPALRENIKNLPRQKQIQTLTLMRQQMGLPKAAVGAAAGSVTGPVLGPAGRTDVMDGLEISEVAAGEDIVWVADPAKIDGGQIFVDQMSDMSVLIREIMAGVDEPKESLLNIDRLGGFPMRIILKDGEVLNYAGSKSQVIDLTSIMK